MFKSAALILSGNAFTSILLFARNLLVARLVSVEDYGIAATFAISMAIVEMMSTLGLHQLIVQDREGHDPELQSGLQGFHLFRGIFSGLVLFLLAIPIAQFLGIPEVAWAYQVMAVIPVARGFIHFDIYRYQRDMQYFPLVASNLFPALVSVIVIWPLNYIYNNYVVMLYSIVLQNLLVVVISHLVAERPYKLALNKHVMKRALGFGWPLLVNNVLLFAVFQGEKVVVGRVMGVEILAYFAMGFTLTLTPTLVVAKSIQSFFLPQLSSNQEDARKFKHLSTVTMQSSLLNGALLLVVIGLLGERIISVLLGSKYEALATILVWLAILQAVRSFKTGCIVVGLSKAHTSNALIANLVRVAGIPVFWFILATYDELVWAIWAAILAEIFGYGILLFLVWKRAGISLRSMTTPIAASTTLIIGTALSVMSSSVVFHLSVILVPFVLTVFSLKDLRRYLLNRRHTNYHH